MKNGQKNSFYNPILQNRTHIKALSNILGKPLSDFTSYVVFSERCSLKKVPEDPWGNPYVYYNRDGRIQVISYGPDGEEGGEEEGDNGEPGDQPGDDGEPSDSESGTMSASSVSITHEDSRSGISRSKVSFFIQYLRQL